MTDSIEDIASRFRSECEADAVGIWQVVKAAGSAGRADPVAALAVSIVRLVLADGAVEICQFDRGRFVPWPGSHEDQLSRLASEVDARKGRVDIGDIGWLMMKAQA